MQVNFQWHGEKVKKKVKDNMEQQIDIAADAILSDAVKNAPVERSTTTNKRKAGSLKKSGRIVKFKEKFVYGAYIRFGGKIVNGIDVYYAAFVDLGTPGTVIKTGKRSGSKRTAIKKRPFLRNSLKKNKRKLLKIKKI